MASINRHGELRLIITRYKPWAQCRDSGKTTESASRQGRDMQNTVQAMGAVP